MILPELSPYQHRLNSRGDDCAEDCPACHWAQNRALARLEADSEIDWMEKHIK
jgi:hypothetical protein